MTGLSVLPGGGERAPVPECGICGVAHNRPCGILARHLEYLRLKGYTRNTIYCRERQVIRLAAALPVPVLDATAEHLAEWRAGLDLSPGAIASYAGHARQLYRWAIREGIRGDNPAEGLLVPRAPRRLPRPVSEDDLMRALECAPRRIRLMMILAAWCGLRACEIAGLLRESVQDGAIPPVLIVTCETSKGGYSERVIPLCRFVLEEIRAARLPARGYIFRRHDGLPGPNAAWRVSQLVNRHMINCGVPASLHQLRHRMLSMSYKATLDLRLVQSLAGHADPRTTSGYAAFASENAVKAVEALPAPGRLHAVRSAGHAGPRTTSGYAGKDGQP